MRGSIMNSAADCRRNAKSKSMRAARSSMSFRARSRPMSEAKATRASGKNAPAAIESHPRGSFQRHDDRNSFRQSLAIQSSRDLDHGRADVAGTCVRDGGSAPFQTGAYGSPT